MWNEKELMKQFDEYFKTVTNEQLMKDLEETGCLEFMHEVKEIGYTQKSNKSDKYKTFIEGEERFFRYVDEVIDHVESATCFEVDALDLRVNLKALNKWEVWTLRDDCLIQRV